MFIQNDDDTKLAIWVSTYSAALTRQFFDFAAQGRGFPEHSFFVDMAAEAATLADLSVKALVTLHDNGEL